MKVLVRFVGPIARDDMKVQVNSVNQLKEIIKNSVSDEWIDSLGVAVNDKLVNSLDDIKDGDVITLLPPVCGG